MQTFDTLLNSNQELSELGFSYDQNLELSQNVRELISQIRRKLNPNGSSLKDFEQFENIKGVKFWVDNSSPELTGSHTLMNHILLLAEAAQLDIENCHPIRQMIVAREVVNICMSNFNLIDKYGELGEVLVKIADECLEKLPQSFESILSKLREANLANASLRMKDKFLEASLFPLCLEDTMQFVFNSFFNFGIFVNELEIRDNKVVGVDESEWGNLSTEPRDLIHFIGTLPNKPTGRIIDWGCGSGSALFVLNEIILANIFGFDKYQNAINLAKENATHLNNTNIQFYTDDIYTAAIEPNDTIYFFAPLRTTDTIRSFFSSLRERVGDKPITIWSKDFTNFTEVLEEQDWLRKTHTAGNISEYKTLVI